MKKLTLEDFQERLNNIHNKEKLKALNYNGNDKKCEVQCLTCLTIYTKQANNFLDKRKVSICKKCFPTQPNILKTDYKPSDKNYELVGEYKGMQEKTLVRHKTCGFIWEIKPNNLENGKGCPRCNKKISKGEQRIIRYLKNNNIKFDYQYPVKIEGHNLICDFYLPDYNLYIEYNGEQHYEPIKYFGGKDKYQIQVFNDKLKQNYLANNLLIISYLDFENIESILKSSTTISQESKI